MPEKEDEGNQIESLNISPKISGIMQSHNNLFEEDNKLNLLFEEEKKQKTTNITTEKANNGKIQLRQKDIFGLQTEKNATSRVNSKKQSYLLQAINTSQE